MAKRDAAERQAAEATTLRGFAASKNSEELACSIANMNAQVAEMRGNLAEAAGIRFDQSTDALGNLFPANGQSGASEALRSLRAYTVARAEFDEQAKASSNVLEQLRVAEERIAIGEQLGAVTGLEALQKLGEARQGAMRQLEAMVESKEAVSRASGSPVLVQQAEAARLALEKLSATADPLVDKFNGVFQTSFGSAFADFITGSKTAGQAFEAFATNVISKLADIYAQQAAMALFDGSGGGLGGFFAGLFSGGNTFASGGGSGGAVPGSQFGSFAVGTN